MAGMVKGDVKRPVQGKCARCGSMSSQELCQACSLLETLNSGMARVELSTSDVQRKASKLARVTA